MEDNFKKDSYEIFSLIKNNDLVLARNKFQEYYKKYKELINDSNSVLYKALPFYKSVEEYLFNDFAKEKKITSIEIIWDNLENDIL